MREQVFNTINVMQSRMEAARGYITPSGTDVADSAQERYKSFARCE